MTQSGTSPECPKCGAPQAAGHVLCAFCKSPYSDEALRTAIACPACKALSAWGQTKCVHCSAWIVVKCVFCDALSPCNQTACLACNEPFEGATQRKAARDAEIERQRTMQAVSTYGSVGASLLGAVAGAVISSEIAPSSHHHHVASSEAAQTGAGLLSGLFDSNDAASSDSSSSSSDSAEGALSSLADAASSLFDGSDSLSLGRPPGISRSRPLFPVACAISGRGRSPAFGGGTW